MTSTPVTASTDPIAPSRRRCGIIPNTPLSYFASVVEYSLAANTLHEARWRVFRFTHRVAHAHRRLRVSRGPRSEKAVELDPGELRIGGFGGTEYLDRPASDDLEPACALLEVARELVDQIGLV